VWTVPSFILHAFFPRNPRPQHLPIRGNPCAHPDSAPPRIPSIFAEKQEFSCLPASGTPIVLASHRRRCGVGTQNAMEGDQMMDQKLEARTLTLGERMVLAARLAVVEHLRQSINAVPRSAFAAKAALRTDRLARLFAAAATDADQSRAAAQFAAWGTP
jgi:hypothetical protein